MSFFRRERERPKLEHEYEAMFAGLDLRAQHAMKRLERLGDQLDEVVEDFTDEAIVTEPMRDDATAVKHLRQGVRAAKNREEQ